MEPSSLMQILGISVEGNTLADPVAIIANSGLRVGDEIFVYFEAARPNRTNEIRMANPLSAPGLLFSVFMIVFVIFPTPSSK